MSTTRGCDLERGLLEKLTSLRLVKAFVSKANVASEGQRGGTKDKGIFLRSVELREYSVPYGQYGTV